MSILSTIFFDPDIYILARCDKAIYPIFNCVEVLFKEICKLLKF